ncbi:Y box binding protein 1 [Rhizoclosmatium sp. JEL0117]|nr:Y box binding protein 1 [Rhizoclosmatium sp. JEL0117]
MSSAATTTTSDQPSLALDQRASVAESPAGGLSSGVLLRPSESHRSAGYVKFFNAQKGYGFIIPHEGEADAEVFVHHTAIIKPDGGFRSLLEGEDVEFDLIHGPKGLQAANVTGPGGTSVIGDPQAGFQQPQPMHSMFSPMMGVYVQSPYLPPGQFPNGAPPSESYNDKAPPQPRPNAGNGVYYGPNGQQWPGYVQTPYGFVFIGPTPPQPPSSGFASNGGPAKGNQSSNKGENEQEFITSSPPTAADLTTPPASTDRRSSIFLSSAANSNSTLVSTGSWSSGGEGGTTSPGFQGVTSPPLDRRSSQPPSGPYAYPPYYGQYYYPQYPPAEGTVLPEDASPQQAIPPEYMNQPPLPQQQLQPVYAQPGPNGGYFYYPAPQPLPPQPVKTLKKGRVPQQHQSNGNTNQTESR